MSPDGEHDQRERHQDLGLEDAVAPRFPGGVRVIACAATAA
jgi:hypothetical protein